MRTWTASERSRCDMQHCRSMGDQQYLSCVLVLASFICMAKTHPEDQRCGLHYHCREQAKARTQMAGVDLLLVPTAAHHYTIQEILSQEEAPGKVCAAACPVRCVIHPIRSPAQQIAPVYCTSAIADAAGGLPARIVQQSHIAAVASMHDSYLPSSAFMRPSCNVLQAFVTCCHRWL